MLNAIIQSAHRYAVEIRGDRGGNPVDPSEYENRSDLVNSAFAALVSVAITRNVQRVEKETGEKIANIANPSLKDGMGPVGIDPSAVKYLLNHYGAELAPMVDRYISKLNEILDAIKESDNEKICEFIDAGPRNPQKYLGTTVKASFRCAWFT